jgi:hypothetical protein
MDEHTPSQKGRELGSLGEKPEHPSGVDEDDAPPELLPVSAELGHQRVKRLPGIDRIENETLPPRNVYQRSELRRL